MRKCHGLNSRASRSNTTYHGYDATQFVVVSFLLITITQNGLLSVSMSRRKLKRRSREPFPFLLRFDRTLLERLLSFLVLTISIISTFRRFIFIVKSLDFLILTLTARHRTHELSWCEDSVLTILYGLFSCLHLIRLSVLIDMLLLNG